jgi:histidinol-phosphate aminotransferase
MSGVDGEVLLNHARNPYGPCPAALEAVDACLESSSDKLASELRRRLSETYAVPVTAIRLLGSVGGRLDIVLQRQSGPFVGFPPSALATRLADRGSMSETVVIVRGLGGNGFIGLESAADLPEKAIALIDSPSDPLGSLLSPADAVRLARACRYVVIDERYAEFSGFSMLPLAVEFDNVVVLRSFEAWAGFQHPTCAWAVASLRAVAELDLEQGALEPESIAAALATLDNLASVGVTLKLIREERSRLYRLLRKLSFLEPVPSWGPFLAARVQMVHRDDVVDGLLARKVRVHAPTESGLERYIRIGIGSRSAMESLGAALRDLAPELVSGIVSPRTMPLESPRAEPQRADRDRD